MKALISMLILSLMTSCSYNISLSHTSGGSNSSATDDDSPSTPIALTPTLNAPAASSAVQPALIPALVPTVK